MSTVTHRAARGHRTIRLPLAESAYERFVSDGTYAGAQLDQWYSQHPELFPEGWRQGYVFYGVTETSRKQHLRCRRVQLHAGGTVWTVAPAFMMPYRSAPVAEVEKGLFLMRFHVPCWALASGFGRDAMSWYRLQQGLDRLSVVGTTGKAPERLPQDLVADEKHSRLEGEKIYIATTAAEECILGASVTEAASEAALTQAYGVFAKEARVLVPDDAPETVNTDGWPATQGAWQALFPTITVMLCFLHALLTIRDRATQALTEVFAQVDQKVWRTYRAPQARLPLPNACTGCASGPKRHFPTHR